MELKATELRVNNYLEFKDTIFQVEIITLTGGLQIYRIDYDSGYQFIIGQVKDFKPIPLTEEWLIRFGFDKKGEQYFKGYCYEIGMMLNSNNEWYIDDGIRTFDLPLKYVHQLQNLYHSLTGEELTIKE